MANMGESKKELVLTRVFDAPRELVWKAWTDPKMATRWWGPRGVTTPTCEIDATPGGEIFIVMLAGKELGAVAGQKWPMKGIFEKLEPPEKLVFVSSALDDKQSILIETKCTLTLETIGMKTKMTFHILVTKVSAGGGEFALQGMEIGWNQSLDKLGKELEKIRGM